MKTTLISALCFATILTGSNAKAGEANPPVPTPPTPNTTSPNPVKPPVVTVTPGQPVQGAPNGSVGVGVMAPKANGNPNNEMLMLLLDMQNGDAAKRDAAGKTLVTKGAPAYRSMAQFLSSQDADLVKRAKDIRAQIEQRGLQLFQDANAVQGKVLSGPLSSTTLEEVRKAWLAAGQFAAQPELRQNATQAIQSVQMMIEPGRRSQQRNRIEGR